MRRMLIVLLIGAIVVASGLWVRAAGPGEEKGVALFREHVRPVLVASCLKCHGGEKVRGGLDLATRGGLLHPGDSGAVVVPGDHRKSRLWRLVSHLEEPHMPEKGAKLSDASIAKIAEWIDAGALYDRPLIEKGGALKGKADVTEEDRKFWSYAPLGKHVPPKVKDEAWVRTDADRFVLAKLEEKGIAPNGVAEKRKLIRRAYFDLIGMPPTPEEVKAFIADSDPKAYEKLVDRLLERPEYGERWGRHWLDLARFAESHGYEQDYDRPNAYHYRDFVIKALNADMPYDRFVKWQIAGDEMAPEDPLALAATGYLAAGTHATQITASQAEKERYDELDDMAGNIGTTMLGMTIACARCHDHKFDPIPTKDYYRFISAFTTTVRSDLEINLDPEGYRKAKEAYEREHAPLVEAVRRYEREELRKKAEAWANSGEKPKLAKWLVLDFSSMKANGGATFKKLEDGSLLVEGKRPTHDVYTFKMKTPLKGIAAVKVEALAHPSLTKGGPGRADNGNFALSDFKVSANGAAVKIAGAKATFEQKGLPVAAAIDADGTSAWAVDPQFGKDQAAVFTFDKPIEGEAELTFVLKFENNSGHGIGRPRISVTTEAGDEIGGEHGPHAAVEVEKIVEAPPEKWSEEERGKVLAYYRTVDAKYLELDGAVKAHAKKEPVPNRTKVLVSSEGVPAVRLHTQGPDFYEKTYYLKRGDLSQKDGEATLGFPQVLVRSAEGEKRWMSPQPSGSKLSYRRSALAQWITDTEQGAGHLLARVMVNRLWQHHMGRGIVATPNDFGQQGERPTHPELLDWLAVKFIESGWKLKAMHRLMMTSAVYMQGSEYDAKRAAMDVDNVLMWRRGSRRLEAEAIRDSMLAVSGMLDATMHGPGTLDESMRRRSIYFFTKRSKLIPLMALFDAPDSLTGVGQRPATTVAPQALALMNNGQVQGYAKGLAKRVMGKDAEGAVREVYWMAMSREPSVEELAEGVWFIEQQAQAGGLEVAMAAYCQAVLCLNEFVYVD